MSASSSGMMSFFFASSFSLADCSSTVRTGAEEAVGSFFSSSDGFLLSSASTFTVASSGIARVVGE